MEIRISRNEETSRGLEALINGAMNRIGKVGWPGDAIHIDPFDGSTQPVAESALENEFGHGRTPARPFMRNTIREEQSAWLEIMKAGAEDVLDNQASWDEVLDTVGKQSVNDIRDTVRFKVAPSLSKLTLALRKKARIPGKAPFRASAEIPISTLPLFDTGHMMQTLDNEVTTE